VAKKEDIKNPMAVVIEAGLCGIHETTCVLSRAFRCLLYDANYKYYH
jgi:hypothetical protein